jgi:hypothetical protein
MYNTWISMYNIGLIGKFWQTNPTQMGTLNGLEPERALGGILPEGLEKSRFGLESKDQS